MKVIQTVLVLSLLGGMCYADVQSVALAPFQELFDEGYELQDLRIDPLGGLGVFSRDRQYRAVLIDERNGFFRTEIDLSPLIESFGYEHIEILPVWGGIFSGFLVPINLGHEKGSVEDFGILRVNSNGYAELLFHLTQEVTVDTGTVDLIFATYLVPDRFNLLLRVAEGIVNIFFSPETGEKNAQYYAIPPGEFRFARGSDSDVFAFAYKENSDSTRVQRFSADNRLRGSSVESVRFDRIMEFQTFSPPENQEYQILALDSDGFLRGRFGGYSFDLAIPPGLLGKSLSLLPLGGEVALTGIEVHGGLAEAVIMKLEFAGDSVVLNPEPLGRVSLDGTGTVHFLSEDDFTMLVTDQGSWKLVETLRNTQTGKATGFQLVDEGEDTEIVGIGFDRSGILTARRSYSDYPLTFYGTEGYGEIFEASEGGSPFEGSGEVPVYRGRFGDMELFEQAGVFHFFGRDNEYVSTLGELVRTSYLRAIIRAEDELTVVGW